MLLGLVGLTALPTVVSTGCGGDPELPASAVAKVGDTVIEKPAFQRRFALVAAYQLRRAPPYRLSDFRSCAAFKQRAPAPAGSKPPSQANLVEACRSEYQQLRAAAMQSLVLAEWIDQEAATAHVRASQEEIDRALSTLERSQFGTRGEFKQFLQSSRVPASFFLEQARGQVLTDKLSKRAEGHARPITARDISGYYASHRKDYAIPEGRAMHVVVASSGSRARAARTALDRGRSWAVVAKAYSTDPPTAKDGGRASQFFRTGTDKELDAAIFQAPKGAVRGPVQTLNGWFVFEIDKVLPAREAPLARVRPDIMRKLREQRRQTAVSGYGQDFSARFRARTVCASGFEITECKNGPTTNPGNPGIQVDTSGDGNAAP
jgi:foldase protein PrsA